MCIKKKKETSIFIFRNGYALFFDSFQKSFGYGLTRVARYLVVVPKYKFNAKLAIIIIESNVRWKYSFLENQIWHKLHLEILAERFWPERCHVSYYWRHDLPSQKVIHSVSPGWVTVSEIRSLKLLWTLWLSCPLDQ